MMLPVLGLRTLLALACCTGVLLQAPVAAQDAGPRTELKRVDLSGAPGMEVITSIASYKPGDEVPLHFHHGVETGYVLQGAMVQMPGKEPTMISTGSPISNLRDARHGGYKVIVETNLKLLTVHIVDKGKPLYDTSN